MTQKKSKKKVTGGSAAERGLDFQARVAAIVMANVLSERQLGWLDGVLHDQPVEVDAESGGPGDDICLHLSDGRRVEIQVKRGLRATDDLWDPLLALAVAVSNCDVAAGVLAVCPNSSGTIRSELCDDIVRMGTGRFDGLHDLGRTLLDKLKAAALDVDKVCSAIRIVTVSAVDGNREAESGAIEKLSGITSNSSLAWTTLVNYARRLIEIRGRTQHTSMLRELALRGVKFRTDTIKTQAQLQTVLRDWTEKAFSSITILGVSHPLSLNSCWIPLKATVRKEAVFETEELESALRQYHEFASGGRHQEPQTDGETLGRYVKRAVVLGGPGIGKSTLLKKLALEFVRDGHLVLLLILQRVASLLVTSGRRFEECLLEVALSSSGLREHPISLGDAVLLCDGLDECGSQTARITEALHAFCIGHPHARVLVTSRPIGYQPGQLGDWRHYDLRPLEDYAAEKAMHTVLRAIPFASEEKRDAAFGLAKDQIKSQNITGIAARSPLMLTLIAALAAKGIEPGTTRTALYRQLFQLIEDHPPSRIHGTIPSAPERKRFLELLGWYLLENGSTPLSETLDRCVGWWQSETLKSNLECQVKVHECLNYWEALGVVERVRTASQEALTFVHKTFGEYAAAIYLSHCDIGDKTRLIAKAITTPAWRETLAFASHLGMSTVILQEWTKLASDGVVKAAHSLDEATEFVVSSGAPIDSDALSAFINCCWKVAANDVSRTRYSAGDALCQVAQSSWSAISASVQPRLQSSDAWVGFVAWTCLCSSPEKISIPDLLASVRTIDYHAVGRAHLRGFVLDSRGNTTRDCYVTAMSRRLLANSEIDSAFDALTDLIEKADWLTVKSVGELGQMFKDAGREFPKKYSWDHSALSHLRWDPEGHRLDLKSLLDTVDDAGVDSVECVSQKSVIERPFIEFGALLDTMGFWQMSAGVVREFQASAGDLGARRVVLRKLAQAAGIDASQLVAQVRALRGQLSEERTSQLFFFDDIPHVDTELDFKHVTVTDEEVTLFSAVALNGGELFGYCASQILAAQVDHPRYRELVTALLANARGTALFYAAQLATELPQSECQALLIERLVSGPLIRGCRFILLRLEPPFDAVHQQIVLKCLAGTDPELAEAAAEFALKLARSSEFVQGVRKHFEEWKSKEEPYPQASGTIPKTPRDELAKLIVEASSTDDAFLLSLAQDDRPKVREACTNALVAALELSQATRDEFLQKIDSGQLDSPLLGKAIAGGAFDFERAAEVVPLLSHSKAEVRLESVSILSRTFLSRTVIEAEAKRLARDPEMDIREAAQRIVDQLT